jgi:hypothetical protein
MRQRTHWEALVKLRAQQTLSIASCVSTLGKRSSCGLNRHGEQCLDLLKFPDHDNLTFVLWSFV